MKTITNIGTCIASGGLMLCLALAPLLSSCGESSSSDVQSAQKYRAEQIKQADIVLHKPEVQPLLQNDEFQKLIRDKQFQRALKDDALCDALTHAGFVAALAHANRAKLRDPIQDQPLWAVNFERRAMFTDFAAALSFARDYPRLASTEEFVVKLKTENPGEVLRFAKEIEPSLNIREFEALFIKSSFIAGLRFAKEYPQLATAKEFESRLLQESVLEALQYAAEVKRVTVREFESLLVDKEAYGRALAFARDYPALATAEEFQSKLIYSGVIDALNFAREIRPEIAHREFDPVLLDKAAFVDALRFAREYPSLATAREFQIKLRTADVLELLDFATLRKRTFARELEVRLLDLSTLREALNFARDYPALIQVAEFPDLLSSSGVYSLVEFAASNPHYLDELGGLLAHPGVQAALADNVLEVFEPGV